MLFDIYEFICDQIIGKQLPVIINIDNEIFYSILSKEQIESLSIITDSDEIEEPLSRGEYIYRYGVINDLQIIYHESTHYGIWPNRIIIITNDYTIMIIEDEKEVEIYETNSDLLNIININNDDLRKRKLVEWFKNTDRPQLEFS